MPRYNPQDARHLTRLRKSMEWSATKLTPFREKYFEFMREYVGFHYGEEGAPDKAPLNSMRMAVDIYARSLAAQEPHVNCTTYVRKLRPTTRKMESAINQSLQMLNMGVVLREAVKSALFMMGVVKVGLLPPGLESAKGYYYKAGMPYAENVLFDDWSHDMTARRLQEWDWCGNRYRVSYEDVMESPLYDKDAKAMLQRPSYGQDEMGFNSGRSHHLSQGESVMREEYRDHIELWDIWLPNDQLLVTLPAHGDTKPLRVVEWEGPRMGPYHILVFGDVPGNVMPAPPAMMWYDMHDLQNRLFLKLGRQAERQKTLTFASGAAVASKTDQRIMDAEDGQVVRTDDPQGVKEIRYGGIDAANAAFLLQLKDLFSYVGGNLDSLGGLSQQGDTLGQEKIIKGSSSQLLEELGDRVIAFSTGVVEDIGWYLYTDPVSEIPVTLKYEGYSRDVESEWKPEHRGDDYMRYNIKIEPFSMSSKSPSQRLNAVFMIVQQAVMPFLQQMQAQGLEVDVESLLTTAAKYADLPEILEIVKASGVPLEMPGMGGGEQGQPDPTKPNGEYTRRNVATGGTQQSRDQTMAKSLLGSGGGANAQQLGSLMRPPA